ncbi:MAG: aspartate ammonia-lyase, partial [Chloroflexi bacterium]|nr:aspartate ammonia-lyase [Chloroflexota bacterium]
MIGQGETRLEHDPLGEMAVPRDAYYGVQTARAVANFPISGMRPHPEWVRATVMVKKAAAQANMATGRLDRTVGEAIARAADEVLAGGLRDQFVVDAFQAGAGTSHNMNANEVLANRASELLGEPKGTYRRVHPNDHVNMAQSSNDVIPTSIRLAALFMLPALLQSLDGLAEAFEQKAREFDEILKPGRTHLQDAVPIRLGQVFAAYVATIRQRTRDIQSAAELLGQLNIGATAIGTGLNAEPEYRDLVIEGLRELTGLPLRKPDDYIEITRSMGDFAHFSGSLRTLALELSRIANYLRRMSSGQRTGMAEIRLTAVKPGSSILPGRVNAVMAE